MKQVRLFAAFLLLPFIPAAGQYQATSLQGAVLEHGFGEQGLRACVDLRLVPVLELGRLESPTQILETWFAVQQPYYRRLLLRGDVVTWFEPGDRADAIRQILFVTEPAGIASAHVGDLWTARPGVIIGCPSGP